MLAGPILEDQIIVQNPTFRHQSVFRVVGGRSVVINQGGTSTMNGTNQDPEENLISGMGTIHYMEMEGGFYGIIMTDGTKLLPLELPETFKKDGMKVSFKARRASVMTIQMWGTPVEILEIKTAEE